MSKSAVRFQPYVLFSLLWGCTLCAMADHLLLQVEDFDGPWRRQTNISGFLGKGFCTSNANPDIAASVMKQSATLENPGKHAVWVRAYTSENSRRALQVEVGGQLLAKTHTDTTRHWAWEKAGELGLPKGETTIVVHDADDGFESVDAIMITDKKDFDPKAAEEEENRWLVYPDGMPKEADALHFVIDHCCEAVQRRTTPKTREEWEARRPELRKQLGVALGLDPMPEKTPLNARVTGKADHGTYTIENVVFESRPNFLVTGNLYIPKDIELPAPAIVVVAGHAMDTGKNCETYQMAQLGFVRQGFIVFAHDPIGQGERKVPGFAHPLGYGSLLVGQTNEGYIVWDTIRALDYVLTRKEVDPERIGLAGNSGGGENTFYTMPFDERFKVGGSFSFVCSYDRWLRTGGNHCICNHFPGIVHLMEEFEIIGLTAPRPFLFGNGRKDTIFPIAGTRETFERAKAVYDFYGAEERVLSVEADEPHGWHQPLREAAYGWMNQWLQSRGDGSPIPEADYEPNDPQSPDLLCFDEGTIPTDSESVVSLNRKLAEQMRQAYPAPPKTMGEWKPRAEGLSKDLWTLFGGEPPAFTPTARQVKAFDWEKNAVETLAIKVETGMEIAAALVRPKKAKTPCPVWVFVPQTDKNQVRYDARALKLLEEGAALLTLDPRGLGETFVHENHLTSDTICLGRHLFAQRVWDVMQAARYAAARKDLDAGQVRFYAQGPGALLGIFAAALGAPFERVVAENTLASFRYLLEDTQPQPIWLGVPNMLKVADVDQVAALVAPTPLELRAPVGYSLKPLSLEEARQEYPCALAAYALQKPGAFAIVD